MVKMLFSMVCCCPQHAESLREKFGPGVVVFIRIRLGGDRMIVALEIEVQLDIKGESEGFLIFTRIKLFLEEM